VPEVHAVGRVVTLERNVARIHTGDSHGASLSANLVRGEQEQPWIGTAGAVRIVARTQVLDFRSISEA